MIMFNWLTEVCVSLAGSLLGMWWWWDLVTPLRTWSSSVSSWDWTLIASSPSAPQTATQVCACHIWLPVSVYVRDGHIHTPKLPLLYTILKPHNVPLLPPHPLPCLPRIGPSPPGPTLHGSASGGELPGHSGSASSLLLRAPRHLCH